MAAAPRGGAAGLANMVARLDERLKHIEIQIANISKRLDHATVTRHDHEALERRVAKMEGLHAWITRLVLTAVILGLLGLLFAKAG